MTKLEKNDLVDELNLLHDTDLTEARYLLDELAQGYFDRLTMTPAMLAASFEKYRAFTNLAFDRALSALERVAAVAEKLDSVEA